MMALSAEDTEALLDGFDADNLVVTGGEPLLQQAELARLLTGQKARGRRIEIETNGTIAPCEELAELVDQWNVSPKTANAAHPEADRLREEALRAFAARPNAWFKFVVQGKGDLVEVEALMEKAGIPRERVLLMPEGQDAETLRAREAWLAPLARKKGFGYTPRLHIK